MCINVEFLVQAVEWLGELLEALLKTHLRLGDDAQDTSALIDKHTKFIDVAQVSRNQLVDEAQVSRN